MQASMEWAGIARTFGLFTVTAVAELLGCYLPMLWLSNRGSAWLLLPAGISLLVFVWLLTLHPAASGRVYATALAWLWLVDGVTPAWTDIAGVGLALAGAAVIAMGHRTN